VGYLEAIINFIYTPKVKCNVIFIFHVTQLQTTVTLTFDALSNQAPHIIRTEVTPVRSFERVNLQ